MADGKGFPKPICTTTATCAACVWNVIPDLAEIAFQRRSANEYCETGDRLLTRCVASPRGYAIIAWTEHLSSGGGAVVALSRVPIRGRLAQAAR